jgi:hypothetical protein
MYKTCLDVSYLLKVVIIPTFRSGGNRPSESTNNKHFKRHLCPGPDFYAFNSKNVVFSMKTPPRNGIFAFFSFRT